MSRSVLISLSLIAVAVICHALGIYSGWWGITKAESISFTILAITAIFWISETVPLFVTSFLIIALQTVWLLPAINEGGKDISGQMFLTPFFSDIILLFLGGFVLSAMLHKFNLDQRIAKWILARSGGEPSILLLSVIVISSFFSAWMSNTATAAMMFAIILPILNDLPKGSVFPVALSLSIPFACNLGGLATPIGTPPNAIALSYLAKQGVEISFAFWMVLAIPLVLLLMFLLWRALMWLFPPEGEKLSLSAIDVERLSPKHYSVIAIFSITCLGWLTTDLHGLSTGMVGIFPVIATFGFRLLNTRDFRTLSWDVLIMLGGGLSLGVGLEQSGLVGEIIKVVPDSMPLWGLLAVIAFIALLMSTFISNTATANLLIPVAVSISSGSALHALVVAMACSGAMALPVSSPPNAIAFGSGTITSRQMFLAGGLISLLTLAVLLLAGVFYWEMLGIK
ncbi:MAG: DASS family sodium-coupled anion symporter [Nitrospinota bacterium]|nr:DASS family sodium-coupled anion symporter [Nitrospinota bacterium]